MPAVAVPTTPVVPLSSPFNVPIVRLVVVALVVQRFVEEAKVVAVKLVVVADALKDGTPLLPVKIVFVPP